MNVEGQHPGFGQLIRRSVLSAFIVFHLCAVLLAPNTHSIFTKKLNSIFEPYLSFFEFTNSWSFFAPDPGPPPVFVEWELVDKDGNGISQGSLPDEHKEGGLRERQNRKIAAVEFMLVSDDRLQKMLVPYLCKGDGRVHSVKVWKKMAPVPSMESVSQGKRNLDDNEQMDRRWVSRTFCEEGRI